MRHDADRDTGQQLTGKIDRLDRELRHQSLRRVAAGDNDGADVQFLDQAMGDGGRAVATRGASGAILSRCRKVNT